MNSTEVLRELERLGAAQTKKTYMRHGCPEPVFGVKVADMKSILKKIKGDTALAKELYRTKNGDAMYLAGLAADGSQMSRADLDEWANGAFWRMISGHTVPGVAVEHRDGWKAAMDWIDSPQEHVSTAGWSTLAGCVAVKNDNDLDLKAIEKLMERVEKTIAKAPNNTRYTMNSFLIAVGGHVKPLTAKAIAAAKRIGPVRVDMGDTACEVPSASIHIQKMIDKGQHGKKRKTLKC